jgi:periplasmic protein TonB
MRAIVLLIFVVIFSALSTVKAQDPSGAAAPSQEATKHVTAAVLVKKVNPEYPKKARKQHLEGTVRLHAIIAKDGSVRNLEVLSGDPLLVDAALKAVRQWRYRPTQVNGSPVEVDTTIDVTFALNKTS